MNRNPKMTYGLEKQSGRMVRIEDVPCPPQYLCPGCLEPLVVRRGELRKWHFAHKANSTAVCESWLHDTAKRLLADRINDGEALRISWDCQECDPPTEHHFTLPVGRAIVEMPLHRWGIQPDVVILSEDEQVLGACEIVVTHTYDYDPYTLPFPIAMVATLKTEVDLTVICDDVLKLQRWTGFGCPYLYKKRMNPILMAVRQWYQLRRQTEVRMMVTDALSNMKIHHPMTPIPLKRDVDGRPIHGQRLTDANAAPEQLAALGWQQRYANRPWQFSFEHVHGQLFCQIEGKRDNDDVLLWSRTEPIIEMSETERRFLDRELRSSAAEICRFFGIEIRLSKTG